jgi:hypothetical protein
MCDPLNVACDVCILDRFDVIECYRHYRKDTHDTKNQTFSEQWTLSMDHRGGWKDLGL